MQEIEKTAKKLAEGNPAEFDPVTILTIIQAIIAIVSMYQRCFGSCEANDVKEYLTSGGPILQRVRRRMVARHLARAMGKDEFDLIGGMEFVESVFSYAESEDIEAVISEAIGGNRE